jgi:hypothetical protein
MIMNRRINFETINDVLYASVVLALFVVTAFGLFSELSEVGLFNELAERARSAFT